MNHIARNLKYYREAAGLSSDELAKRVSHLLEAERMSYTLETEPDMVICLARALGITVAELVRDELPPPKLVDVRDPGEGEPGLDSQRPLL